MKKDKQWDLLRTEPVVDLGILDIQHHFYKNPRNDKMVKTVSVKAQDAVNVIALTKDKKVIMVKQFRFGIGDYTLEIPGGIIDEGEDILTAAKRELREETGFVGEHWEYLGRIYSNPVFIDATVHHYLAKEVTEQFELELDDAEHVELMHLSIQEVYEAIQKGEILHPHTITAFHYAHSLLRD